MAVEEAALRLLASVLAGCERRPRRRRPRHPSAAHSGDRVHGGRLHVDADTITGCRLDGQDRVQVSVAASKHTGVAQTGEHGLGQVVQIDRAVWFEAEDQLRRNGWFSVRSSGRDRGVSALIVRWSPPSKPGADTPSTWRARLRFGDRGCKAKTLSEFNGGAGLLAPASCPAQHRHQAKCWVWRTPSVMTAHRLRHMRYLVWAS